MLLDLLGRAALIASLLVISPALSAESLDWPQWRGPTRDGVADGDQWPESLSEETLQLAWRVELGSSYSGPVVVGDRVFTTETRAAKTEVASAYDRRTGDKLWETEWPGSMRVPFFAAANGSWIRATPAADESTLYVAGIKDVLVALDTATGDERWRIDFPAEVNSAAPKFGCASSPLLDGDALYAQIGRGFTKIDKRTGEILWRVARDSSGAFSSPFIATENGRRIAIVQTRQELKGIDAENGEERWSQPIEAFRGMNILTPTVHEGKFFTSAHTGRSQLWEADAAQPGQLTQVWSNKSQAYMSSPVVVRDHLYMHLRNQRIQCINLATGEQAWRTTPFGKYQSMVVLGSNILALDQRGELILFRATPDKFEQIDKRKISEAETWAHIAVCGGQLFVRELNALAAYDWKND